MCDDQAVRLREETQKWALWMMLTHVLATGMPAPSTSRQLRLPKC